MVLFFTGTGNSRYIAERIAEALGDEFLSAVKAGDKITVKEDGTVIVE